MIRVGIAEDHPEMRVSLRLLIKLFKDMELVWEASHGQEALACLKRLPPDVLVMGVHMSEANAFAATKQIIDLAAHTRVILISFQRGSFIVRQAAAAGAHGFLPKEDLAILLQPAIEAVLRGETFFTE
jgi:DNA-binding NarL/FixJ family response regulator